MIAVAEPVGLHPAGDRSYEVDPLDHVLAEEEHWRLRAALNELPERMRRVLELRYGFDGICDDADPWTLDHVGRELDLTRERVRQIEAASKKRLQRLLHVDRESKHIPEHRIRADRVAKVIRDSYNWERHVRRYKEWIHCSRHGFFPNRMDCPKCEVTDGA